MNVKGLQPQQFVDELAASVPSASWRWAAIQDYVRENADMLFHALGGSAGVTKWAHEQYDRFCAPIDIPWMDESLENEVVDKPAKHLLKAAIEYLHAKVHVPLLLLAFVLGLQGSAAAQQDCILVVAKNGYYLLETDSTGIPVLTPAAARFKQVIVLGEPGPGPAPSPDMTPRALAARDAAAKVTDAKRAENGTKLATLYKEISLRIRRGELAGADVLAFIVRQGGDMVLTTSKPAWQGVLDVLTREWGKLAQEGAKDADFAQLLDEVAAGISATIPRAEAQAIDLAKIIEIVKLILELISKLPFRDPATP